MRLGPKPCLRVAATAAVAIALAACSSVSVHTHLDRDVDFARYRTFDWIEQTVADVDRDATASLDATADPVLDQRIRRAVEEALATRGLVRSADGTPDLRLRYAMQVRPRIRLSYPGYCGHHGFHGHHGFYGHHPHHHGYHAGYAVARRYYEGTMALEVFDAEHGRLVWRGRGIGRTRSDGVDGDDVQAFVDEILEKFPTSA